MGFDAPPPPDALQLGGNRPHKPTDDELGDQLLGEWNGRCKFIYSKWHRYENGVWRPDEKMTSHFWDVLIANKKNGIKPNAGKAASVEKYCQLRALVDEKEVDQGNGYINLKNGLFDLETHTLQPHRPDLYLTSQLPFEYDEEATCFAWTDFIRQVLVWPDTGAFDPDLANLVQEAFYYSLTGDTSLRVSFWLVGPSGTGKSTLLNVLLALAGNSHVTIDLDSLKDNQYQLAEIAGKRVVSFSEPDSRAPLADGWYKKLVSKDPISVRAPYGKPFSFVPSCKVWGSMNDTPRTVDRSDAVFGRVNIIPMKHVIPYDQRDGRLDEKLLAELPGIFNWVLAGGKRLKRQGAFTFSQQSHDAREEYRSENDVERLYKSERLDDDPAAWVTAENLYQDYRAWCLENGYQPKQKERVGKDWKRLGLVMSRTAGGKYRIWQGVRLREKTLQVETNKPEDIPF